MTSQPFLIPLKKNSIKKFKDILPKSHKVVIFDIDNTLYCDSTGLEKRIVHQIHEFAKKCGISANDVVDICQGYSKTYGLAIKGFLRDFPTTDVNDFYNSVDGSVNIDDYISRDEELIGLLEQCPYKIYCFTNACYKHAIRVLDVLGVTKFITGIFYCEYVSSGDFICKPDSIAYEIVEALLNDCTIYFLDDNKRNVEAAEQRGWHAQSVTIQDSVKSRLRSFYDEDVEKVVVKKDLIIDEINRRFVSDIEDIEDEGMKENKMMDK